MIGVYVMETIEIEKIVSMYNNENKSLNEIGDCIGKSKSTVQKMLTKHGYKLNRKIGKYENNISIETIQNENNVSRETNVSKETLVNRTYAISEKIDRAIKIKSAVEGVKPIDIIRKALDSYIEDKYKNM